MIKHSYYEIYKTAICYLMTIFQQTLIRYTNQIRDKKVRTIFQIIQAEIGDTKKTISDTWFQL